MMNTLDRELWRAIETFDIDGGPAAFTFEARLARENGWTRQFAKSVITEYRRFLFLAATAGHPVTPSDEVDQAWHLHMTYTRSYWDRLCGEVLHKPLHHDPTRGGRDEGIKFEDWYARTKESYFRAFGHAPPTDVWPDAAERFGEAEHFARINTRRYCLVKKPRSWSKLGMMTGACAAVLAMAGCMATLGKTDPQMVLTLILIVLVLAGFFIYLIKRGGGSGSGCGSGGCGTSGCGGSGCGGGGCGGGGD